MVRKNSLKQKASPSLQFLAKTQLWSCPLNTTWHSFSHVTYLIAHKLIEMGYNSK